MAKPYPGNIAVSHFPGRWLPLMQLQLFSLLALFPRQLFSQTGIDAQSFSQKLSLSAIKGQRSVITTDLDGDGKPDLVIACLDSNTITVYRNTGSRGKMSFDAGYTLEGNDAPYDIASGDLDGDGRPDLVISNSFSKTISIFKNRSTPGNMAFDKPIDYPGGVSMSAAAIADLNGDGKPEIVVACSGDFAVSVYRNTSVGGDISFAGRRDMVLETYPKSVAAADIDGDGKTDLAVQLYDVGLVSVYRNISAGDGNGEGSISFAAKKDFETDNGPAALHAADLDGDGRVDLVVTNYDAGTVSILRNTSSKGVVSFAGRTDLAAARAPLGTVIADLDGDGKPDLAVANTIDNTVSVLRNMGNVSFGAKIDYATDAIPQTVVSADFDGDGRPDLATADLYAPTVAILYRDSVIRKDTAAVAMQRLSVASSLTVYPNPVTDRLMAFVPGIYYDSWFRLIDMNGKLMEILPVRAGTTQVSIAMSSFSRGVYRLVWTDGINLYSQAIVRQ